MGVHILGLHSLISIGCSLLCQEYLEDDWLIFRIMRIQLQHYMPFMIDILSWKEEPKPAEKEAPPPSEEKAGSSSEEEAESDLELNLDFVTGAESEALPTLPSTDTEVCTYTTGGINLAHFFRLPLSLSTWTRMLFCCNV